MPRSISGSVQCPVFRPRARKWSMVRCVPATSPISGLSMRCWRCRARHSFPQSQRALAYLDLDLDVSEGGAAKRFLIKPVVTGENAAGGRNQGHRQGPGGRLRHRISAAVAASWRAGDGDRKRPVAGGEGRRSWPSSAWQCDGPGGRGRRGGSGNAPYDVIVLDGATEIVPERLYRQLREGGRLVGVFAMTQPPRATIVTHSHDDFGHRALFDAAAPVLPGLERLPAFVF